MSEQDKTKQRLEIAHVLFMDIVDYSKLLTDEQSEALQELNQIVRSTEAAREAEAAGKLTILPTGDGGALVFRTRSEAPVRCAIEITKELQKNPGSKEKPQLRLRMGIHSGPVNEITDLNKEANIAGAGINVAQRIMDCGDAGHILLSQRVAEDLEQYPRWRSDLHDLGECEVKHGARVHPVNFYNEEVGNPAMPEKFKPVVAAVPAARKYSVAVGLVIAALAIGAFLFWQQHKPKTSALTVTEKSIAVLPFENLSRDPDSAFFTDGVQDEILTDLSKIADLKVISRTSVMQYKSGLARNLRKIGKELGVAHVLEGSVQRAANKIRVNAQLIDARNDAHLWAQTYDRDLADVFAIQSEIAKTIADQLQAKLSPNEKKAIEQPPTADLAAFDFYSRAKSLLLTPAFSATQVPDVRKAVELLDEAVKRDPSFFDAYCQLAYANGYLYAVIGADHTPARLALAEVAVQAATRLRPDAGKTHLARAQYLYYGLRDYAGALAELERARKTLPNDPRILEFSGYILRRCGQQKEGLRNLQRALVFDPRNFFTLQQIAISYVSLQHYAGAIAALDWTLSIVPDNVQTQGLRATYELCWKGDTQPLHQMIDAILAQRPGVIASAADTWFVCALAERDSAAAERALVALGDNPWWSEAPIFLSRSFGEGLLARMTKDEARARIAFEAARAEQDKRMQAQPDYGPALCVLGMIDAGLGRKDLALEEGRRAIALTPIEKDLFSGCRVFQYFAITAAWAGDKELALRLLETGLRAPAASVALSYGALKLYPFWDPLRGDPRFEKIVASLAPKEPPK